MAKELATPNYSSTQYRNFNVEYAGTGGLKIRDLEYNVDPSQSPDMVNMIVRNGVFGKRRGGTHIDMGIEFDSILSMDDYGSALIVQATKNNVCSLYKVTDTTYSKLIDLSSSDRGSYCKYNRMIYFMNGTDFIQYDGTTASVVKNSAYAPDIVINRSAGPKTSDTYNVGDLVEDYNRLGAGYKCTFDGDGTHNDFWLIQENNDSTTPLVEVGVNDDYVMVETLDGTTAHQFTYDKDLGKVCIQPIPVSGTNNVVITAYKTDESYVETITKCKYMYAYGGDNSNFLFVGGNGNGKIYYSSTLDASYFPESNYMTIARGTDDITGFCEQSGMLCIFTNDRLVGTYYTYDSEKSYYTTSTVNDDVGCDCPNTIQFIDNRVTWLNSKYGVCCLANTNVRGEKNVYRLSRNIDSGLKKGLLNEENIKNAFSINHDGKYWILLNNKAYVWDYESGYIVTKINYDDDKMARKLSWYKMEYPTSKSIGSASCIGNDMYYSYGGKIIKQDDSLSDDGETIHARYKTMMNDFDYIDYLKNIKKMFVSVRGDTPSQIKITYYTDEEPDGVQDEDDIIVPSKIWNGFSWKTFGYSKINWEKSFARNVSIKKVFVFGVLFTNDENYKDMSISSIKFYYLASKKVR